MTGVQTAIELTDRMTAPLMSIVNALNLTMNAFQDVQNISASVVDTSGIEGAREQVDAATAALQRLDETLEAARNTQAVNVNTSAAVTSTPPAPAWQSPQTPEVFNGSGMARYQQEAASMNQMLSQVMHNQQRIAALSNQTDVFPDNMLADLQTMDARIQGLRDNIAQMESNPINDIGADAVNNDLETLRSNLNQAMQAQNDLSNAMERMDISDANSAYNRLNNVIDSTDVHIRENMGAQDRFNNTIQQGHSVMDGLKGKIMGGGSRLCRTAGY